MPGEADILQPSTPTLDEPPPRVLNDKKGGVCPFGHGLLAWARVELDDGVEVFYLERCSTCSGVFFDDGEWDRLAHSRMLAHLTSSGIRCSSSASPSPAAGSAGGP